MRGHAHPTAAARIAAASFAPSPTIAQIRPDWLICCTICTFCSGVMRVDDGVRDDLGALRDRQPLPARARDHRFVRDVQPDLACDGAGGGRTVTRDDPYTDVPLGQPEQEFPRVGPRCVGDTQEAGQAQSLAAQAFQCRLLRDRQVAVRQRLQSRLRRTRRIPQKARHPTRPSIHVPRTRICRSRYDKARRLRRLAKGLDYRPFGGSRSATHPLGCVTCGPYPPGVLASSLLCAVMLSE
ncbi:hypothetical protein MSAS_18310 [Mycobacterium saskatchewanense]|nr:hypothetical protein MSAS_18310 [Mycobacterium saskatchewanense]